MLIFIIRITKSKYLKLFLTNSFFQLFMDIDPMEKRFCELQRMYPHRTKEEKNYLETRLKTVEGQVRGVAKMIDEDK